MIDRSLEPHLKSIDKFKITEAEKIILDCGIPVYVIHDGSQPLLKLEFIFMAGSVCSPQPLVAIAANDLMDEGTKNYSAYQLAEGLDFYGAYLSTESNADYASISLYTLNKFFDKTLPFVYEILTEPTYPQNELQTYVVQNKQKLAVNNEKVEFVGRKIFAQELFGKEHAYGYYASASDFEEINQEELKKFHSVFYRFSNCNIIVSGKIEKETLTTLNKVLSSVTNNFGQSIPSIDAEIKSSFKPSQIYIEKKEAVQSAIRIGKRLFNKKHPDFKEMMVLNTILGGYFGSRLMTNIREEKGYTYGIGSAVVSLRNSGYFTIATEVGKDVCEAAVKEIYYELNRLCNEPIATEELELVKNYLIGSFQRSIDGPFALADRFKNIILYDLDYSYYHDYLNHLKGITRSRIMELASLYLKKDFLQVIVG